MRSVFDQSVRLSLVTRVQIHDTSGLSSVVDLNPARDILYLIAAPLETTNSATFGRRLELSVIENKMDQPASHRRDVNRSRIGDNARINMGDIHYHLPHPAVRAEVVRVIPYPRNEDLVLRPDLVDKLDELLPPTPGSRSAALWGLGGSG
jgi:hypothetical protein